VDAEKELRELKKRLYIENGVYLYKCERCEHLVALHQEKCIKCKAINSFHERPEKPITDEFMNEVDQIYKKKDEKRVEVKRRSPKMSDNEKLGSQMSEEHKSVIENKRVEDN
jgi:predicted ATP-dependent serine protease